MKRSILVLTILCILFPMSALAADLTVTFLDVGQADAIYIECDGQSMLVDAGSMTTANSVVQFLKGQGVETLHYLVGTHPHEGHIGGFVKVLEQFAVENVWVARVHFPSELQEDTEAAIQKEGLEPQPAVLGQTVSLGDATVTVIGPVGNEYDALHSHSLVLRIDHGETSFLLAGDMEADGERELIDTAAELRADVLKVGSHGSTAACTPEFLEAVSPGYAVISCGKDMAEEQVIRALEQAGATVLRTDQTGNITLVSDGKAVTVQETADAQDSDAPEGSASETQAPEGPKAEIVQSDDSDDSDGQTPEGERLFGKTNAKGVNVRERADAKSGKFASIGVTGTKFEIYETVVNKAGETWYRIKVDGTDGYILGDFVDLISKEEYDARTLD